MNTNLIEEFKSLRTEEMAYMVRRTSVQNIGTLLFSALVGASFLNKSPELSLAAAFLMLAFWHDDIRWLDSIAKMGAYIREVIEPRMPGLGWQASLMQVDETHKASPTLTKNLKLLLSRYPATVIIAIVSSAFLLPSVNSWVRVLVCLVFAVIAAVLLCYTHFSIDASKVHRKWGELFRTVRQSQEKAAEDASGDSLAATDIGIGTPKP